MPYSVVDDNPECDGYAVVKDTDGTVMGCHKTRKDALAQQAALYASESALRAVDLGAPEFMRNNAKRGLRYYEQGLGGDGLVRQTIADARKMANGEISEAKWRKIGPWISRHMVDLDAVEGDEVTAGVVAHLLWGSGRTKASATRTMKYAQRVVEQLDREQERNERVSGMAAASVGSDMNIEMRELPPSYRPSSSDDVPVTRPSCGSCEYFCLMPDTMNEGQPVPHCHKWNAAVAVDGYCDAYEPAEDEGEDEGEGGMGMGEMEMDSVRSVSVRQAPADLVGQMQHLLADTVSFYFQAHGAHWNVRGADFAQYHDLFGDIYEDVYSAVDPTAENVRKLGGEAPFRLSDFLNLRTTGDIGMTDTPYALAVDLLAKNDALIMVLRSTFDLANSLNEQGIANFISERIDKHQKWSWQLRSSTENVEMRHTNEWVTRAVDDKRSVAYTTFECRAAGEAGTTLIGYAALFDSPSVDMGFTEYVRRGAFTKTLKDGADVRLLLDHEGAPLARTKSGTLRLSEDERGLRVEADLDPANPVAQTVLSAMRRGDMNQMSFAFRTIRDSWSDNGKTRELREVQLYDVSVVTFPAYEATVAEVRAAQGATIQSASQTRLRKAQVKVALANLNQ